ncbi:MAG: PorP/SprF family type IX secretion system membrane protein [Bacteroidota bacterium]
MKCALLIVVVILASLYGKAQEAELPTDFRQHNLTQFNASLWNPTFALDWNIPKSLAVWSRWQWQTIDGDPTTIFVNYTGHIAPTSVFGIGFLQHNTGFFLNTGGILNYSHTFTLGADTEFAIGTNVPIFQQELADDRFIPDNDIDLSELQSTDDLIMQVTAGARLMVRTFSLALALENTLDVNLSESNRESTDPIFSAILSNDFPVHVIGLENSFLRPLVFVRSIPDADTQLGVNLLFSTPLFWVQGGYNDFYGISGGIGTTLFKKIMLGGLLEFATDNALGDPDPTIEIVAAYQFGKAGSRKKGIGLNMEKDSTITLESIEKEENEKFLAEQEAVKKRMEEEKRLTKERQRRQDSIEQAMVLQKRRQRMVDSINQAEAAKELVFKKARQDSIAKIQLKAVDIQPGEKYEEVVHVDGLQPGFYLIANVFGTKKYYENFMQTLHTMGLDPKSFYRSLNGYNYVYLERYDSIDEARKARDSQFEGRYPDKTWIFRVRGN